MPDPHVGALASCISRVRFPKGATLFAEGERSQEAYLVDTGKIRIQRKTPYGLYTLADLGDGELFGENSFIDGSARTGEALVIADSVLMPINPVAINTLTDRDRAFTISLYWAFWKSLANKLRNTNESLANFFQQGAAQQPSAESDDAARGGPIRVDMSTKRDLFREQKLSQMEINFLSTLSKEQRVAANEVIFREGDPGDRMYIILEGQVMISKQIVGAGEEALAVLGRGDYFGEMALIDHEPRSAYAKAHDEGAVVLSISRDVLENILHIDKQSSSLRLLRLLCNLVAKRLREVDDKLIGWYIFAAGSGESLELPNG
ncbi:MAG: cyclic nucleotide-binding domain-containing protein [Acidobacteriota bacterium]